MIILLPKKDGQTHSAIIARQANRRIGVMPPYRAPSAAATHDDGLAITGCWSLTSASVVICSVTMTASAARTVSSDLIPRHNRRIRLELMSVMDWCDSKPLYDAQLSGLCAFTFLYGRGSA